MRYSLPLLFFFLTTNLFAQEKRQFFDGIRYQTEAGAYLSTSGQNAFWLRSNQYGTVPLESQILTFRAGLWKDYQNNNDSVNVNRKSYNRKFDYGYGIQAVANVGKVNQILLPEAYFKVKFKAFEFYVGRRREIFGLVDTTLSSGSYIWSGNALPLPKVQISIPDYTSILGKGLLSIKGNFAHGWFNNDRPFTKHVKLHQKSLYLKLGKPTWKINMYGGFNHQVQWGGESPTYSINGKLPQSFRDYLSAVLGIRGARHDAETDYFDANRVGNHLGTIDIGLKIHGKNSTILVYRQNIYEDGSLYYLTNITDGLNGLSINLKHTKLIQKLNFELLSTTSQGGNVFTLDSNLPPQLRGMDNYFSNGQYVDGWTYKNSIIGTPFIQMDVNNGLLKNNTYQNNNKVQVFHCAFTGIINSSMQYSFKYSQSNNLINNNKVKQSSSIIALSSVLKKHKNTFVNASFAFDTGQLYHKQTGIFLSLLKKW